MGRALTGAGTAGLKSAEDDEKLSGLVNNWGAGGPGGGGGDDDEAVTGFGDRIGRFEKLKDCRDGQEEFDAEEEELNSVVFPASSFTGEREWSLRIPEKLPGSSGEKLKRDPIAGGGGGGDFGAKKLKPRGAIEANSSNSEEVTIWEMRSKNELVLNSFIRGTLSATTSRVAFLIIWWSVLTTGSPATIGPFKPGGAAGVNDFWIKAGDSVCDREGTETGWLELVEGAETGWVVSGLTLELLGLLVLNDVDVDDVDDDGATIIVPNWRKFADSLLSTMKLCRLWLTPASCSFVKLCTSSPGSWRYMQPGFWQVNPRKK